MKRLFEASLLAAASVFVYAEASACDVPGSHLTIQDAINDSSCTTIDLTGPSYTESVVTERSVTITGRGSSCASAKHTTSWTGSLDHIVDIRGKVIKPLTVNLRDLNLGPKTSLDNGAGVHAEYTNLNLDRVTFLDLQAQWGAAIYAEHSNIDANLSCFNNNAAVAGYFGAPLGGAIAAMSSDVLLHRCSFNNNSSEGEAGALFVVDGDLNSNLTSFVGNTATFDGGAVKLTDSFAHWHFSVSGGGTFSSTRDLFKENASSMNGGAVQFGGWVINIQDSDFIDNSADGDGGAIDGSSSLWSAPLSVADGLFSGNAALASGGAIHYSGFGTLTLDTSRFDSNIAGTNGGAVRVTSSATFIDSCQFIDNLANVDGGGLFATGERTEISESVFNNNVLTGNGLTRGGGAFISTGDGHITSSALVNNAAVQGSGLWLSGGGAPYPLTNVTLSNNQPLFASITSEGGGAYVSGTNLAVSFCTLARNRSDLGANIALRANSVAVVNQTIVGENQPIGPPVFTGNNCDITSGSVLNSAGYNIDMMASCNFTSPTDQNFTDPCLLPLFSDGTASHVLDFNPTGCASPAIDAGGGSTMVDDQISTGVRPLDGDGNGSSIVDIGARERLP